MLFFFFLIVLVTVSFPHNINIGGIWDVVDFAVVFSTGKVTKGPLSQEQLPTTGNP